MGIVKKNAIMMIDFALEAERKGALPPEEAIREACLARFRPIMMTTLAALLGACPLAFASGTGAELETAIGHFDYRRVVGVPGADVVHDAGGVAGAGAPGRTQESDQPVIFAPWRSEFNLSAMNGVLLDQTNRHRSIMPHVSCV